jgi:hypothetical protein
VFRLPLIALAIVLVGFSSTMSQEKQKPAEEKPKADPPDKPSTEPRGVPLELRIINSSIEAYEIDPRGDPVYKFQEKIKKAEQSGLPLYPTRVEMELEFKNTGSDTIQVWVGGDPTLLTLKLEGNGAMTCEHKPPLSKKYIPPETVTIRPGKTHRIPLTQLSYGFRNDSTYAYISETGLYQLSATFRTAISPAPKKALRQFDKGFGEIILKAPSISFRVVRQS